jgi:hypothetical protein
MLDFSLDCSSALKMKAIYSPETPVKSSDTAWCYIPEDRTLHASHCENLKYGFPFMSHKMAMYGRNMSGFTIIYQ